MIDLDKIYNSVLCEKQNDTCIGDIYIKLIVSDELQSLVEKEPYEQIAFCVLDENGNRHFNDEQAIQIKEKMPLAHQDDLCNLIMKVNKFSVTQEDIEKN